MERPLETLSRAELKRLRALRLKKTRRGDTEIIVEGVRACESICRAQAGIRLALATAEAAAGERVRQVLDALARRGARVLDASPEDIQSLADVETAQGLLAVCAWRERLVEELLSDPPTPLVALDGVSDPGNAGSIVRAADWFGAGGLVAGAGSADLLNPKSIRAAAGSVFNVPLWRGVDLPDTLRRLQAKGFRVVAATPRGRPAWREWRRDPCVLVLGNEGHGLSADVEALADDLVAVPGRGRAESLNAAMAATVLLAGGLAG